jgi:hypothetical protein
MEMAAFTNTYVGVRLLLLLLGIYHLSSGFIILIPCLWSSCTCF